MMKHALTILLTFVTAIALFTGASFANANGQAAQNMIEQLGSEAMSAITDKSLTNADKSRIFKRILSQSFDMETAARFAAGRHWRELNDAQRREYLKLYEDMIIRVYSGRFNSYNGQKFNVLSNRADESGDIVVNSTITGKGAPVNVAWRLRSKGKNMRIIDVFVEGVSMAVTQRNDFASVIQREGNNVNALLNYLRQGGTSDIK